MRSLLQPFRARLSRTVALGVLASIVAIEAIILIPSYWRRERELIDYTHRASTAKILAIARWSADSAESEPPIALAKKLVGQTGDSISLWKGVALYDRSGRLVSAVGEAPELGISAVRAGQYEYLSADDLWLDIAWPPSADRDYTLIVRHDVTAIYQELQAFILRIVGLVLLISVFATAVTMVVLSRVAIVPILRLRDDLRRAADLVSREDTGDKTEAMLYACQGDRPDELGEVMMAFRQMYDRIHREILDRRRAEQESETLLLNILPPAIAERLKRGEHPIAERFDRATVLFADLVDFTGLAANIAPAELVQQLNQIFSAFDTLADSYQLEKIKTIGDAYMVVGGVPQPHADCVAAVADMALAMQRSIVQYQPTGSPATSDRPFAIRIGIHTGPVVGGVIGIRKFIYDLWGDTVNTASRMESHGMPGHIQVTEAVYLQLRDRFRFERRGEIAIKGKGTMTTYWLRDRLATPVEQSEGAAIEFTSDPMPELMPDPMPEIMPELMPETTRSPSQSLDRAIASESS